MKLLSWMNRKSKLDITEPRKIFSFGNSCSCLAVPPLFDEQLYQSEPRYTSAHSKQAKKEYPSYSDGLVASKEEEVYKEEAAFETSALFHGFLTIGTLGSEPSISEPTTPKFPESCENVTEKESEVTETELMLINDELEKFLQAEAKDVNYDSSKRSSFVSTITLSNFETEGTDAKENQNMVTCPLQSYLFSSSIERLETGVEGSLEKLFKNSYKTLEGQKADEKPSKGTCAREFMKKMLKKIRVSTRSTGKDSANGHAACTVSTKRKLPKALQMLQRKIHPETSMTDRELNKPHKYKNRTKHQVTGVTILEKDNHKFSEMTMSGKNATTISINNDGLGRSHSTGNGEHWIKSDANYVVLEL